MDKKAIVSIVLSVIVLIGWQYFYASKRQPAVAPTVAEAAPAFAETPAAPAPTVAPQISEASSAATPAPVTVTRETRVIGGEKAEYTLSNKGGGIESILLKEHLSEHGEKLTLNEIGEGTIGALSSEPGQWPAGNFRFDDTRAGDRAVLTGTLPNGVSVVKELTLAPPGDASRDYVVDLKIQLRNDGAAPVSTGPLWLNLGSAYPVHSKDLPTYTGFDWYADGKLHDTGVTWFDPSRIPLIGIQTRAARDEYRETIEGLDWTAVKNQYFTTLASVREGKVTGVWAARSTMPEDDSGSQRHAIHGAIGFASLELAPGETKTLSLQFYTGPKQYSRLKALGKKESDVMQLGFFKPVSIFLLKMMNWLQSVLGNYAAAIVVMTLIIKSALWPLQNISTRSMRKMQALQPKMAELKDKYKDDPTRMNTELMKLYKDYGVNPFSGCLPMLVQIPIFFGFYRMLGVAPELRNSPFLWINDLSQPDTVAHLAGFPINILPLIMAVTMVWQMQLTPKSGDAVQQRVFMFVPLIFVVFCYNYAAALALYWTVQNLFSVVQLYLTRNQQIPALTKVSAAETPKKKRR